MLWVSRSDVRRAIARLLDRVGLYVIVNGFARSNMLYVVLRRMSFCKLLKGMFNVRDGLDRVIDEEDI